MTWRVIAVDDERNVVHRFDLEHGFSMFHSSDHTTRVEGRCTRVLTGTDFRVRAQQITAPETYALVETMDYYGLRYGERPRDPDPEPDPTIERESATPAPLWLGYEPAHWLTEHERGEFPYVRFPRLNYHHLDLPWQQLRVRVCDQPGSIDLYNIAGRNDFSRDIYHWGWDSEMWGQPVAGDMVRIRVEWQDDVRYCETVLDAEALREHPAGLVEVPSIDGEMVFDARGFGAVAQATDEVREAMSQWQPFRAPRGSITFPSIDIRPENPVTPEDLI